MVSRALADNVDGLSAASRVKAAEAQVRIADSGKRPALSIKDSATYDRALSTTSGGGAESLVLQPGVTASWALDLCGRLRALSGAARASYVAPQADRDATTLAVASAAARAYVSLLSIDMQLYAGRRTLAS